MLKLSRHIVHVLSNMQNEAILRPWFVIFCKQRQINEQRRHAYKVCLHSHCTRCVAFEICLIKLPNIKPNKRQNNEQPNEQKKTNESLSIQKGD